MGRNRSDVLLEVILDVLSDEYCIDEFKLETTENMFCAGFGTLEDTCQGDSGGPLLVRDKTLQHTVIGNRYLPRITRIYKYF